MRVQRTRAVLQRLRARAMGMLLAHMACRRQWRMKQSRTNADNGSCSLTMGRSNPKR